MKVQLKIRKKNSSRLKAVLKLLPVLFFSVAGMAARAQEPVRLSLQDALNYAVNASNEARKAKLDIENSEYQIEEVKSRALPQISGSAGLNYNPILQKSALPGEIVGKPGETLLVAFGQKWNGNAGISLNQTLFDNSVLTGLKAAKTTKEFYQLNAELTDEQIIEQVATTYYSILVQRQQLQNIDTTISNTQKVLSVLNGLYKNGLAKKIDVDRISVNYSNLSSQRQQLINGIELLGNQLKFYMGMPIQTALTIPDVELSEIHPVAVLADEFNLSDRTELEILNSRKKLLQYQKEAFKSEYMPSLSLSGSYSYQGLGAKFPVFNGPKNGVNWFDVAMVGLNLRVPIFNGFATRSRVKQADISIKKLEEDINQTQLALNLEYENAKTRINNSLITLNAQKKNMELAEQVYHNTENNYNNGLATLTDLLQSETSLSEAQTNYSKALLDYKISEIQIIKAKGNLKSLLKS